MVKAGNRIIFDENKNGENISRMVNKGTGAQVPIRYNGIYEFDMWVKDKAKYGQYGVLTVDDEEGVPPVPEPHPAKRPDKRVSLDFHRHT